MLILLLWDLSTLCVVDRGSLYICIQMSVAEWVDTYGIHHRRIIWSSYRKLAWVGFEPTTTEFHSDALTDWAKALTLGYIWTASHFWAPSVESHFYHAYPWPWLFCSCHLPSHQIQYNNFMLYMPLPASSHFSNYVSYKWKTIGFILPYIKKVLEGLLAQLW